MLDTIDDYKKWVAAGPQADRLVGAHVNVIVPCTRVALVARHLVRANTYNPNTVPGDRLALLVRSIVDNGFCFPVVTILDAADEMFVVIDGFHRWLVTGPDWLGLSYVPIVVLTHDITQRMTATMQFNKARGHHQVDLDAEIVRELITQGLGETEIAARLGLDEEAVHRYKQISGVASVFARTPYSLAWEMVDDGK